MKINRKLKLIVLVFGLLFFTVSLHYVWDTTQIQRVTTSYHGEENLTEYTMTAVFMEENMSVECSQKIVYRNQQGGELADIYLHLYPNAFKQKEQVPFEEKEMQRAYPNGFNPGYIEIINIKQGRKPIEYKIMGEADTVLRITPEKPLQPGDTLQLFIDFIVKLPNAVGRMGYGENTVNITNWFPIIAVYDEKGWNLDPYYAIGDPFYSEVAKYNVEMSIPKEYKIAATGNIIKIQEGKDKNTYKIEARLVRNFVMILSQFFEIQEATLGDTKVISYSIEGHKGEAALQYGLDSLKIFNNLFGIYPYKQLSIVASDFFIGGMEYPNVVMIGQELYEMKEDFPLEYVVAHEVAHQWWYGIVGNNEVKEPWLDEALTEYTTLMYFEQKYGHHIKDQIYEKMIKAQYENYIDVESDGEEGILRSLKEFDSSWQYSSIVYSRGAMFIKELRDHMGDEAFFKALREYFEAFKFKNATTKDFYDICRKNTEKDLSELFQQWLNIKL
ncbi:peptidase M1, membrane alanine aminopeptidase-like protein [Clostridium aceticum]|uniref:Peptidase M1, membrane alanine aminopeptidase-like protein n=1 Tax=Clostridium aceticum TaxID=84022 RepID=A0A0D8IAX7_9CLOT|nr:M1 family metallopeptidase [Clostridium aceticum]AKL97340.1 peptidase M1, membrane alanine aminopeptidase-like protein [Clostridium aceticum]KJF26351.1 peptidase M1 [Clostridium aceticum]